MTQVYISSDHAGLELKDKIVHALKGSYDIQDLGVFTTDSVDYPDLADVVCQKIPANDPAKDVEVFGILVCGSGQGMVMRANRYKNVRAALCFSEETAQLSREHNNANVLCLGARTLDQNLSLKLVPIFLITKFAGGRHAGRVLKIHKPC